MWTKSVITTKLSKEMKNQGYTDALKMTQPNSNCTMMGGWMDFSRYPSVLKENIKTMNKNVKRMHQFGNKCNRKGIITNPG